MTTDTRRGNAVDNHVASLGKDVEEITVGLWKAPSIFVTSGELGFPCADPMTAIRKHTLTATVLRYRSNGSDPLKPHAVGDIKEVEVHSISGGYAEGVLQQKVMRLLLQAIRRAVAQKLECNQRRVIVPKECL